MRVYECAKAHGMPYWLRSFLSTADFLNSTAGNLPPTQDGRQSSTLYVCVCECGCGCVGMCACACVYA
jgi:hypothetical protein